MDFYSEEEKRICKIKIESEGKEMLSQRGCLSTTEINEIAESFYEDIISSPKSIFSIPQLVLSGKDSPFLSLIFIDILNKNRYEIWFVEDRKTIKHPWNRGGLLVECSSEFPTVEAASKAASIKIKSILGNLN
jgi:hypothetical protein